jgi:hypothetical protein
MWAMLVVSGAFFKTTQPASLVIDARKFPGKLQLVLPPALFPAGQATPTGFKIGSNPQVKAWATAQSEAARRLFNEAKYPKSQFEFMIEAIKTVADQKALELIEPVGTIPKYSIGPRDAHVIFMRIDLPANTRVGSAFEFDVQQRAVEGGAFAGGSRYRVVVNKKASG